MNYLAIDTSGAHLTVLIEWQNKTYKYYEKDCGVKHSVSLMREVERLKEASGFDFSKADFFACVVGAGSFTGIRIGVSTIKALCFAYNKPCLAITSFDTIAYNKKESSVLAIIDAGHNGYYVAGYSKGKVDIEPSYLMKEQLDQILKGRKLLSLDKITNYETEVVDIADGLQKAIKIKSNEITDVKNLTPLYIRKSQAEENR